MGGAGHNIKLTFHNNSVIHILKKIQNKKKKSKTQAQAFVVDLILVFLFLSVSKER